MERCAVDRRRGAGHGADTVFGLPGVHNLAFWLVPERAPLVVRHEQTAVYAADGWARATGRLGAAVVTTGPGAANAVAAFGEAAAAGSPVCSWRPRSRRRSAAPAGCAGCCTSPATRPALFRPLAKAVFTPAHPRRGRDGVLDAAVAAALRHPRGPVYLDVPADVLGQPAAVTPLAAGPLVEPRARAGRSRRRRGRAARDARAVVWAGGGCADHAERVGRGWPPTSARPWSAPSAAAAARRPRTRSRSGCRRTSRRSPR